MKVRYWFLFFLLLVGPTWASAESIWSRQSYRSSHLFVDIRARKVGDQLTITINEATDVNNKDKRQMDKKTATSFSTKIAGNSKGNTGDRKFSADLSGSKNDDRSFEGESDYNSSRDFTDRMAVTVMDVMPNGNLVIEGSRTRFLGHESRTLRVSGVVRPDDIIQGNIVESRYIANFKIWYEGAGAEDSFTNQGWLGRRVNKLWPY